MKIVVIGGTGLIGVKAVAILCQGGHEVIAASHMSGVSTTTGEELQEALNGAQVVINLANCPLFKDKAVQEFFKTSGCNLLAAEATADESRWMGPPLAGGHLIRHPPTAAMGQQASLRESTFDALVVVGEIGVSAWHGAGVREHDRVHRACKSRRSPLQTCSTQAHGSMSGSQHRISCSRGRQAWRVRRGDRRSAGRCHLPEHRCCHPIQHARLDVIDKLKQA